MADQDPFAPSQPLQEWLPPATFPHPVDPVSAGRQEAPPPMYELRPLTTSEVLDRTFAIYRTHFWLFSGIASVTAALQSLVGAAQMLIQAHTIPQLHPIHPGRPFTLPPGTGGTLALASVAALLMFLAGSVVMAACVFAMGETYLGRATSVQLSFRATIGRWYSYIGIAFWLVGSILWPSMVLVVPGAALIALSIVHGGVVWSAIGGMLLLLGSTGGLVLGAYFGLRNTFGVPIAVLERMRVRAAMQRSKLLTKGAKWRILLIGLITWALFMVVGVLQMPLAFLSAATLLKGGHAYITQGLTLVINFVGYTVVTPVALIGNTLLYFDQRVRKEAFDIAFLLGEERALESDAGLSPSGVLPNNPAQAIDVSAR